MRDYSKYEKTPVLFSGAEKKFEIIIDGFRYIVKFQKNSEVGLTFNYVSEYLGSHISHSQYMLFSGSESLYHRMPGYS